VIVMREFRHATATVVDSEEAEGREEALHRFVRERRLRLAPESHFLGKSPRVPTRVGKVVTQEELAEHLGISRQWYARFEGGTAVGFSTQLLSRLCDLLLLSRSDRAEFVRLAMPEVVHLVREDIEERVVREGAKRASDEYYITVGKDVRERRPEGNRGAVGFARTAHAYACSP
jgi:transcriptional regulator with XRE-family HTH domain